MPKALGPEPIVVSTKPFASKRFWLSRPPRRTPRYARQTICGTRQFSSRQPARRTSRRRNLVHHSGAVPTYAGPLACLVASVLTCASQHGREAVRSLTTTVHSRAAQSDRSLNRHFAAWATVSSAQSDLLRRRSHPHRGRSRPEDVIDHAASVDHEAKARGSL